MITLCDMTFSDVQRHKLVHLLREVGPDAPTLCEGWTTLDLIIHLVIRENYPLAAAGMMVPQLSAKLAAQTQQLKATVPYTGVTIVAGGEGGSVVERGRTFCAL